MNGVRAYYYEDSGGKGVILTYKNRVIRFKDKVNRITVKRKNVERIADSFEDCYFSDSDFKKLWESRDNTLTYEDNAEKFIEGLDYFFIFFISK